MIHNHDSIVIMIQLFFHQYVITTQVEKKVENFLSVRFSRPETMFFIVVFIDTLTNGRTDGQTNAFHKFPASGGN